MIGVSETQDHLLKMFDKLHVLNLSSEGANILKSMADSIRSALEKGLLLEQIILNQKNHEILGVSGDKVTGKSNKSHVAESLDELSEPCSSDLDKTRQDSASSVDVIQSGIADMKRDVVPNITVPDLEVGKIKPVDKSLLINNIPLSSHIENEQTMFTGNDSLKSNSITNDTVHLGQFLLPVERSDIFNQNKDDLTLMDSSLVIKTEPQDFGNSINSSSNLTSEENQGTNNSPNMHSSHQTVPFQKYDEPLMPTPFLIKCEHLRSQNMEENSYPVSEPLFSSNLMVHSTSNPGTQGILNNSNSSYSSVNNSMVEAMVSPILSNQVVDDTENAFGVYIEGGRDMTEDEVKKAFENEGVPIVSIKIIRKNLHSFGFVHLESEDLQKKAIDLSQKFVFDGRKLLVRQLNKKREKNNTKGKGTTPGKRKCVSEYETSAKRLNFSEADPRNNLKKNSGIRGKSFGNHNSSRCDNYKSRQSWGKRDSNYFRKQREFPNSDKKFIDHNRVYSEERFSKPNSRNNWS